MPNEPTMELACPAPDCTYKPPERLSVASQTKALARHISLNHEIGELPRVVSALKAAQEPQEVEQPQEPPQEPEEPQEPPQEPPQEKAQSQAKEKVGVQQRAARTESSRSDSPGKVLPMVMPSDPKKERIDQRTQQWSEYLFKDFNPWLVSGVQQFTAIPEPWMDGGPANGQAVTLQTPDGKTVTFWNPPLREQLSLSEKDCNKIARAGAHFAESPMGQAVTAWLEHNAHFIALGSALIVAGAYGWRVMRIKAEVAQLQEAIKAQQTMEQPQTAEAAA